MSVEWHLPKAKTESELIREFRARHKLTQEQFGILVDRSRSAIAGYESGATEPDGSVTGMVRLLADKPTYEIIRMLGERVNPSDLPLDQEAKALTRFLSEGAQSKSYPVHPDDPNSAWRTEHGVSTKRFKLSTLRALATTQATSIVPEAMRPAIIAPELDGRLSRLGVTYILADSVRDAQLPILADGQAYWTLEGENVSTPTVTMSAVSTSWQTVGSSVAISRRLILQADDAIGVFARSLVRSIAREIDRAILHGTGFNGEPRGILQYPIGQVEALSGAGPAIFDAVEDLELNGIDSERIAIVAHPSTKRRLTELADYDAKSDWVMTLAGPNQRPFQTFRGYRAIASDKYSEDKILVGDFSQCVVRLSGEVEIKLLDKHRADGAVECYAFQDVSFEMPFVEKSFVEIYNVP